jgi:drug/metabolite transporter (DMT)-like permease
VNRPPLIEVLLLLMAIIWGSNFAVIKTAFRELNPQAFNALRMAVASIAFLAVMGLSRAIGRRDRHGIFHTTTRVTGREWLGLAALGFVGHALYQYFFIGGLARTSVANSSLVLAASPVVIALLSAIVGHERVSAMHWAGAAVSALGIYLVVGQGLVLEWSRLAGDLMMFAAVCCWAAYTIGARPLMARHSPVGVTGLSMALGTAMYLPVGWSSVRDVDWNHVSAWTIGLLVYSALFALCVAYTIWYVGVRQIGSARTAAYSNLIPIVAMLSAVFFLKESISGRKIAGAAAVLAGVALTRVTLQESKRDLTRD